MILAESIAVPSVDPIGLPGAPLVFVALLLLTQFLHLLFMNFVLGGSVIAVGLNAAGLRGHPTAGAMARVFYRMAPVTISMAITMGVAPLLFVQVLYGPYFYSATVLMGFVWFSFFVAVLVGFYLAYWLLYRGVRSVEPSPEQSGGRPVLSLVVSVLAAACFLWVAWVMANNHELSIRPSLWRETGYGGSRWYTPAGTTLARYLHDVVGAAAVAGLWLAGVGWWRARAARIAGTPRDALSVSLVNLGVRVALFATMAQVGTGALFHFRLTPAVRESLFGFNTVLGGVWMSVLMLIVPALVVLLMLAFLRPRQFRWYGLACAAAAVVAIGMLFGREHVRLAHLGLALPESNGFTFGQWKVYPQNTSLLVFAALLVAGLAVVGLMVRWLLQGRK